MAYHLRLRGGTPDLPARRRTPKCMGSMVARQKNRRNRIDEVALVFYIIFLLATPLRRRSQRTSDTRVTKNFQFEICIAIF